MRPWRELRRQVLITSAVALAAAALWWSLRETEAPAAPVAAAPAAAPKPSPWANPSLGTSPTTSESAIAPDWTARFQSLFQSGSLQGASLDGDWGRWDGKSLYPSLGLRRRFDQLLSTRGETELHELRAMVQSLATQDLGPEGARAVLAVWDSYITLVGTPYPDQRGRTGAAAMSAAYASVRQLRRELLGPAWADVFFREEEAQFDQAMTTLNDPTSAPPLPETERLIKPDADTDPAELHQRRVAEFGSEAAERMREEAAYQARWAQRLGDARAALAKINTAPELSPALRVVEVQRYLDTHFEGGEQVRVRALLGI